MKEWKKRLEEEGRARDKAIQALRARQQLDSIESVSTKSGVVKYTEKIKGISTIEAWCMAGNEAARI